MFDVNHLAMKFYLDELHRQVGRRASSKPPEPSDRRVGAERLLALLRDLPLRRLVGS